MLIAFKNISFLLFSVVTFSAMSVHAADIPMFGPIPFEAFDENGDKSISPQEFVATHNQRIKMRADANKPSGRMVRSFTFFDTDGDNKLSADELNVGRGSGPRADRPGMNKGRQAPDFATFDLNGDGVLMREEFDKARGQRMSERANQGYPMRNAANAPPFGKLDVNRDGKVTQKEFLDHQVMHQQMRGKR